MAWVKYILVGQGGKSEKTIGGHGQKDKRSKNIQRNTSESGIKCVCLNARSIINKKTELNIMVDDIKPHIIYSIICLKSVCRRSQNAVRNSCSISSGDGSN